MFFKFIKNKKKYIFFSFLILIIFYRSPFILIEGRFMAEEGTILFRHAFLNVNLSTLFYLSDVSGYINIWLNVSTIFSNIVPLKYAPLVSVYLAFILLIYIFFYILFSTSHLLLDFKIKCVACSIVLFSPIMTAEVWLSPLNSMSYFGILTFLILFDKNHHTIFKKIN